MSCTGVYAIMDSNLSVKTEVGYRITALEVQEIKGAKRQSKRSRYTGSEEVAEAAVPLPYPLHTIRFVVGEHGKGMVFQRDR